MSTIKKFTVKDTKKYGKGVFATRDIKKGEVIFVFTGERIDIKELVERFITGKEYIDDPFQIGRRTYLDLDETSRSFNHNCDPNGGVRKTAELYAIKDIKTGEQITYDYGLIPSPTEWSMKCRCGSKICRKVIGDIRSVPKKRLEYYKKLGNVQSYMKRILNEIDNGTYKMPKYEKEALKKIESVQAHKKDRFSLLD